VLELPAVQRFYDDAQVQGVHLVTIVPSQDAGKAAPLAKAAGYSFPILVDTDGKLAREFRVAGVSQTIVLSGGRVTHRLTPLTADRFILELLRDATGVQEIPTAGASWTPGGADFQEENGEYVAKKNGKTVFALPLNRGRWTTWPDGIYLDSEKGDVLLVATARGTHSQAGSIAVDEAIRLWTRYVAAACPPSAQVTTQNVRTTGAFGARALEASIYEGWPEADIVRQIPSCGYDEAKPVMYYVAPDEKRQVHRALWVVPKDVVVFENLERWKDAKPGERRPVSSAGLRNHMEDVRNLLRKEGRVGTDPLK